MNNTEKAHGNSIKITVDFLRRARDSDHFVRPRVCSANYPIIDFFWQDSVLQKIIRVRIPFLLSSKKQDIAFAMPCFLWRRARDSNPRTVLGGYTISNRAPSTSSDNSPCLQSNARLLYMTALKKSSLFLKIPNFLSAISRHSEYTGF